MIDRTDELKSRIEAKRSELEAQLKRLKADAQGTMNDQAEALESKLSQLSDMLKGGWENITEQTARRLNEWLE